MITPINFKGLNVHSGTDIRSLTRLVTSQEAYDSASSAFSLINKLSGDKDVFLKVKEFDPREDEKANLGTSKNKNYDYSKCVKVQITDKDDNVCAEVKTYADEPQGSHSNCIAKKFLILTEKFAEAMNSKKQ